jgi:hypothetical protein
MIPERIIKFRLVVTEEFHDDPLSDILNVVGVTWSNSRLKDALREILAISFQLSLEHG